MANQSRDYPSVVAGIDLGSNSFHMIVMRRESDERIHILDRIREPVRLAAGLNEKKELSIKSQNRALEALARFAQRLRTFHPSAVRVVGTNTLRCAKNGQEFLQQARNVLGYDIDIISGREEARLIYLGVAQSDFYNGGNRLVVDIGGGSTELILGFGYEPDIRDSLYMGCVSYTKRFFHKGTISKLSFERAELAAKLELSSILTKYQEIGWSKVSGASGTFKSIGRVLHARGGNENEITKVGIDALIEELLRTKRITTWRFPSLDPQRAKVFPGGVSIAHAIMTSLNINKMEVATGALREGVAFELLGEKEQGDIRHQTAMTFAIRYKVDLLHAERVRETAIYIFKQVTESWKLAEDLGERFLYWAALTHEIGLSIAYAGNHKHCAYIIRNAEMPGFSRAQQNTLAAILRSYRRCPRPKNFRRLTTEDKPFAIGLAVILRLATLLNRERLDKKLPHLVLEGPINNFMLRFPENWLANHPLTQADLEQEANYLSHLNIRLQFA